MNKNSIILALAATAHVHGAENTLNKHNHESILGKRAYQGPQANDNLAKRQKTDPNPPEQIDSPRLRELKQRLAKSGPISVVTHYLPMSDALKMVAVSKKTREKLKGFLPEKYNNATKQWEKLKKGDNLDKCFAHCGTTVLVPSIANAIQDLPGIIGKKEVNHIKIAIIEADPDPDPRPEGWHSMVNALFTDPNPNNNSLTFKDSLTFKVVQPDDTASGWDIKDVLRKVSNVKNVIYEGKTGNEKIEITIPANVGNKCVTVRNAKKLCVVDVVAEVDRSVTRAKDTNAQFTIKGNGDLPATITASSDGGLCHTTFGAEQFALTTTLAEGRCALTFGHDPTRQRDDTIRANSDSRICHQVFDTDPRYLHGAHARYLHQEFKARGQSELTVASGIITVNSNEYARCENYHDDARYTRYIAEACGTDNTIQVNPTGKCTIKADSDDTVCHKFQFDGGHTIWEGTAKGCKEIKAELSIDEERKIQLESPIQLLYAYYHLGFYPYVPYQSIKTDGRSTITACPNEAEASKRGGIVESKDDILYRKVIDHKRINAFTHIAGKAQDLQYTEVREGKTIHDVLIKGGADFALKDNPEVRKITIKGDDVDYKNDGDTKHPEKPFSGRSGQVDILLDNKTARRTAIRKYLA